MSATKSSASHLSLDATALLALHVDSPARTVARAAMARTSLHTASALALAESIAAGSRLAADDDVATALEDELRRTWDGLHVVPVDQRCLDEAAELASKQPVTVSTAIHLVAARRLGPAGIYLTFDPAHIPVALSLGLEVVSG